MDEQEKQNIRVIADFAEQNYWKARSFIDANVPNWVHGDDSYSYPMLVIATKLRQLAQ